VTVTVRRASGAGERAAALALRHEVLCVQHRVAEAEECRHGFVARGAVVVEAGIDHVWMEKRLA
jgi:hypothetical protein